MRRRWCMKDVRWRDFLLALVLAPVLVIPVVAAVYVVLFVLIGLSSVTYPYWLVHTLIATCTLEGFLFARLYRGDEEAIEHGWAWLVVVGAIPAVLLASYAADLLSTEVAWYLAAALYTEVASVFLLVMLAVYFSARKKEAGSVERRRVDIERDRGLWLLRR